jgi:uncharacterized protein YdaU (DUF1376 family)
MKNSPSFQFYPQDFLSDIHVQSMTMEERGAYITLLCHCWIENGIPTDSRVVEGWFKQGSIIARCFYEKDGVYRNKRLDLERQKHAAWRKKSQEGGRHSAEKKRNTKQNETIKGGSRVVKPPSNSSTSSSTSNIEKDKNPSLCPRKFADVDIRLTQLLVDFMKKNNPDSSILKHLTEKRQAEWINQCRLLRESDGRSPEQIEAVIRFSQDDPFWKQNILSMPKLREKWDQLWLKAQNASRGPGNGRGAESPYVGSRSSLPSIDKDLEKKLLAEYEVVKAKFMKAKGYKTEDDIPFDEHETFFMFKNRRVREMKQGGVSC